MKKLRISVSEETYLNALNAANRRGISLSTLVEQYLQSLSSKNSTSTDAHTDIDELIDNIWTRHQAFSSKDNLPRDQLYDRNALR